PAPATPPPSTAGPALRAPFTGQSASLPAAAQESPAPAPAKEVPAAPEKSAPAPAPADSSGDASAAAPPPPPPPQIIQDLHPPYEAGSDDEAVRTGEEWLREHPQDVDVRLAVVRSLVRKAVPLRMAGNPLLQTAWNHLEAARKAAPDRLDVRIARC